MLTPVSDADLYEQLSQQLLPGIRAALDAAGPGQRLRVTTLPVPVMDRVCESLQGSEAYRVFVLAKEPEGVAWRASSTKLIELRNVLHEPLLVFIPPDLRTAAEDSLDIATFTELALRNVTDDLRAVLLERLPEPLRKRVVAALEYIRVERILLNADEAVQYLLTVVKMAERPRSRERRCTALVSFPTLRLSVRRRSRRGFRGTGMPCAFSTSLVRRLRAFRKSRSSQIPFSNAYSSSFVGRKPNCRIWGRDIAEESAWSDLSFDQWKFAGDIEETAGVRLILEELDLPLQTPDQVSGAAQLPVLNLEDTKAALKVFFHSFPRPAEVPAWTHFRFQILSTADGDPAVAWESNSYPKPAGKQKNVRRAVKAKDLQSLEEGTYFVKVDAYDANGNLLTTVRELDPRDPESRKENESEHFLVVRGDAEVEQTEARAVFTTSLIDAWASLSTRALGSKGNGRGPRSQQIAWALDGAPPCPDAWRCSFCSRS